jgi:hypothetical protein
MSSIISRSWPTARRWAPVSPRRAEASASALAVISNDSEPRSTKSTAGLLARDHQPD